MQVLLDYHTQKGRKRKTLSEMIFKSIYPKVTVNMMLIVETLEDSIYKDACYYYNYLIF